MSKTAKLGLPLVAAAQAQKHVTHNEALAMLDTLVQLSVLDRDLNEPPAEPEEGDGYIVGADASGPWSGWEDRIVRFQDGAWISLVPRPGWLAWAIDEQRLYSFDGASWYVAAGGGVVGPESSLDNRPAWFDGTSGQLLKVGDPTPTLDAFNAFTDRNSFPFIHSQRLAMSNNTATSFFVASGSPARSYVTCITGSTGVPRGFITIGPGSQGPNPLSSPGVIWENESNLVMVTNTPLDGTSGDDNRLTISVNNDGTVGVENRLGGTRNIILTLLGD